MGGCPVAQRIILELGEDHKFNEGVDERWEEIRTALPGDHCVIMPSFAVVYAQMSPVLVSSLTEELYAKLELPIHHEWQTI